jgi:uncharacterized protein YxjI
VTADATAGLTTVNRFWIRQKITVVQNRYQVFLVGDDGGMGAEVCEVAQKRFAFKEQVMFTQGGTPVFGFKARKVMDLGATYDVVSADGSPIGLFRKDFKKSLLRSTWHLEQPGRPPAVGQERSIFVALVRRVQNEIPLPYHFDFAGPDGQRVMSLSRKMGLRDKYLLEVHADGLDRRLAIAMSVALDALQSR